MRLPERRRLLRWSLQIAGALLIALGAHFALERYFEHLTVQEWERAREDLLEVAYLTLSVSRQHAEQAGLDFDQELALIQYNARLAMVSQPALIYLYVQSLTGRRLASYIRPAGEPTARFLEEFSLPLIQGGHAIAVARFGYDRRILREQAMAAARKSQTRILLLGAALLGLSALFALATHLFNRRRARRREQEMRREHLAELGGLASGLAHEIRNPLGPIKMNVQLLREAVGQHAELPPEEQAEMLDTILNEVAHLEDLLAEFLLFARPMPLKLEQGDLVAFLEYLLEFLSEDCRRKGIELAFVHEGSGRARFDRRRLKQAFFNIIVNAIQAMPEGGALDVSLRRLRDQIEVVIEDTGHGIEEERMDRLFEPFYSTKPDGTGLGLGITRRVILEHGGTIRIESRLGEGTRVIVRLPVEPPRRREEKR